MMYDLVIVGAGPAGCAAGVYAARKKLKTLLITESFGGQSITSMDIQNWIGEPTISGYDLAKKMETHVKAYPQDVETVEGDVATAITKQADGTFLVATREGKSFATRFLFLAMGSRRRKLNVPGEKELDGHGVVYCATCDAPLFKGKEVIVAGGGNSALEAVVDLFHYATKIYVAVRGDSLRGDPVTQEKVKAHANVEILFNTQITEIHGEGAVREVVVNTGGTSKTLAVGGVFVEIGAVPNSEIVKDLVMLNAVGEVVVDHKTQATSDPSIFAAGDVSDVLYKQNNISAGDAVKAILTIEGKVHKGK